MSAATPPVTGPSSGPASVVERNIQALLEVQARADRRADLDLQVSLLAEHEVTRLITLVQAVAAHLGIDEAGDPELDELKRDVAPERVLDEIERVE